MSNTAAIASAGDRLFAQADAVQKYQSRRADALLNGNPIYVGFCPDKNEWNGDEFALAEMASAFSREEHNQAVNDALKDKEAGGVLGDLTLSAVQADMLACQERAYRCRQATPIRRRLHAIGISRGHGNPSGIWERGLTAYVTGLQSLAQKKK